MYRKIDVTIKVLALIFALSMIYIAFRYVLEEETITPLGASVEKKYCLIKEDFESLVVECQR